MLEELQRATRYGDPSIAACAHRLHLSLSALNISQSELASAVGFQNSSITNMVKARQFPSRDVMLYLYFQYGVDFNFMFIGDVVNLRKAFVDRLILAMNDQHNKVLERPTKIGAV